MLGRMDVTSSKTVFERNANIAEQAINILDRYAPEEKGMLSYVRRQGSAFPGRI